MKLELTEETLKLIGRAWEHNVSNMADGDRTPKRLWQLLFEQPAVRWYQGPGRSWIYVTEIAKGQNANMHALNLDGWQAVDVPLVRKLLLEIMTDYDLRRLTIAIPAPCQKVATAAKKLGFVREGTVRQACIFNERHVDVSLYGILLSELLDAPPKKRRARRSRRKKWQTISAMGAPSQISSSSLTRRDDKPASQPAADK